MLYINFQWLFFAPLANYQLFMSYKNNLSGYLLSEHNALKCHFICDALGSGFLLSHLCKHLHYTEYHTAQVDAVMGICVIHY